MRVARASFLVLICGVVACGSGGGGGFFDGGVDSGSGGSAATAGGSGGSGGSGGGSGGTGGGFGGTGGTGGGFGGTAGAGGFGGTAGAGAFGGSGGDTCSQSGTIGGDCTPDNPYDTCQTCVQSYCCAQYEACVATNPEDRCGWYGGPSGDGEIFCWQSCMFAGGQATTCAAQCTTPGCGTIAPTTNALIACLTSYCQQCHSPG